MKTKKASAPNSTPLSVLAHTLLSFVSLFLYGFGVHLTIRADLGAAPWDVFNLGLSGTLHILYGTASIAVSMTILIIDILMREPIGISMFIDAVVVGKTVDLFDYLNVVPTPRDTAVSIALLTAGLVIMGYAQFFYMKAALGCGPRDTLLVGLKRHLKKVPIGVVSILLLSLATLCGWLLGGKVGIGTLLCAFASGPIMQLAFRTVRFDPTSVRHQSIPETVRVLFRRRSQNK